MKSLLASCQGFTIIEVLVSVAVLSITIGTIGAALFQSLAIKKTVVDNGLTTNELRRASTWFSKDVKNARTASVNAGVLTLNWVDRFEGAGSAHVVTYAQVDDQLVRSFDENAHPVARKVQTASFTVTGRTVTAQIEIGISPETMQTLSARTNMRPNK